MEAPKEYVEGGVERRHGNTLRGRILLPCLQVQPGGRRGGKESHHTVHPLDLIREHDRERVIP